MGNHLQLYEGEQGDDITITGKKADETTDATLSWVNEGNSTIEIKNTDDTVALTLTGTTDFTFSDPAFTWAPTDAQMALLEKGIIYSCYIHARLNSTPRERVLKFTLTLLDS